MIYRPHMTSAEFARRTVDEEDADDEGDRYEDDYWRRGGTA